MKRALLATVAAVGLALPVAAVIPVEDILTETNTSLGLVQWVQSTFNQGRQLANEATQINNQVRQITHAVETVNAVAHGNLFAARNLVPELANLGLIDPWDGDVQEFQNLVLGAANTADVAGNLVQQAQQARAQWQFYTPDGIGYRAAAINAGVAGAAAQLAAGGRIMEVAGTRSRHVGTLLAAAGTTRDVKDSMDVAGRLAGETAVSTGQVAQGVGVLVQGQARAEMRQQQDAMAWRASADQLGLDAREALRKARAGQVDLTTGNGVRMIAFNVAPMPSNPVMSDTGPAAPGMAGEPSGSGGGIVRAASSEQETAALRTMTRNFGSDVSDNARNMGINPNVLGGVCMMESGCRAIGSHSAESGVTASGPWGFTNGTFRETARQAGLDPAAVNKDDPAVQSIVASQYLKNGAQALQRGGISTPTGADAYGYHMWGPRNGLALATADDSTPMAAVLSNMTPATLARNGVSDMTVGRWRQNVINRMQGAGNQPVLI